MKRKSLPTGRDFLFVEGYGNENPGAFQSTRPLRGATSDHPWRTTCGRGYFNPRAPCGARPGDHLRPQDGEPISTHAPLAGRDTRFLRNSDRIIEFQPTRPLRGATWSCLFIARAVLISTHAPLAGRDGACKREGAGRWHFNPRAPCGARQQKCTNHYAHFCDNRQISDAFAQNAACQGILLLFDAGKPCGFWVRTAQVISAHLCFAL